MRDGHKFFRSRNGVWLVKKVDAGYFEQMEEAD